MGRYICGPSVLVLPKSDNPVQPGDEFEFDFSVDGPDGEYGPARESALLACGAITPATPAPEPAAAPAPESTSDRVPRRASKE